MRILFWTEGFWPRIGGIETQAAQFVQELQEKGHECFVLAHKDEPSWKEEEEVLGVPVRRLDFRWIVSGLIERRDLSRLRVLDECLMSILREFKPDVIHLNQCMGSVALLFCFFRKCLSIPVVLTVHSTLLIDLTMNPLIEKTASFADRIGCVSTDVCQDMQKGFPHLSARCKLIYDGVKISGEEPLPLPFSPPVFLCLGRLSYEKGFDVAIEAFYLLRQKGVMAKMLIVGDGPESKRLKEDVKRLQLQEWVEWAGAVEFSEVPSKINQASAVLVPSFFESFGLSPLEALLMERPVIASAVGGLLETLEDGVSAFLVPPKDPAALAEAMERLLLDRTRMVEMGKIGKLRTLKRFSMDETARQYECMYEEIVCRPSLV